jgi:hypothetical protein
MYDFYLHSTENQTAYEPRGCKIMQEIRIKRDSYVYVRVHPPIEQGVYSQYSDVSRLILGRRHFDPRISLLRIKDSQFPVYVNIGIFEDFPHQYPESMDISDSIWVDIGEVHKTLAKARRVYEKDGGQGREYLDIPYVE